MFVLPDEILTGIADIQKSDPEVVNKVVDKKENIADKVKAVLRINLVRQKTLFDKYKKSYFVDLYGNTFKVFEKQFAIINAFILPPLPPPPEEEILENIDLPEIPKAKPSENACCKSFFGKVWNIIKIIWKLIKSIFNIPSWVKKIKDFLNLFKWPKKRKLKRRKFSIRKLRRRIRRLKNLFKKLKNKAKRFFRRRIKPIWRRFKKWMKKNIKRWAKRLKTVAKKVIKKLLSKLKRIFRKVIKKVLIKLAKKLGKMLIKQAFKWLLRIVASALTATGIGAAVGVAIFAATIAWDAYDLYQDAKDIAEMVSDLSGDGDDDEEDDEDDEIDEIEDAEEKRKELEKRKKEKQSYIPPNPNIPPPPKPNIIEKDSETAKVIKAFKEHSDQKYQIFGELFELYEHTQNWLYDMDDFQESVSNGATAFFNATLGEINKKFKSKIDIVNDEKFLWENARIKLGPDKTLKELKKDKSKIKPLPDRKNANTEKILKVNKLIMDGLKDGQKEIGKWGVISKLGSDYSTEINHETTKSQKKHGEPPMLKTNNGLLGTTRYESIVKLLEESNEKLIEDEYDGQEGLAMFTKLSTMRKYVPHNPADISQYDGHELFKFDKALKEAKYNDLRSLKIKQMHIKNRLLYDIWNREVWIEESAKNYVATL